MPWYLWVIASCFLGSLERAIDKAIVIGREKQLDGLVAAFHRNNAFFFFILLIGVSQIFGPVTPFFTITYSSKEIIGIIGLIVGSYVISQDFSQKKKSVFSWKEWCMLFFSFCLGSAEYLLFKYYNEAYQLNEVSFYNSMWTFVTVFFLIAIVITNKQRLVITTAKNNAFFIKTGVSKGIDAISSLFAFKAITLATASKVYLLESIFPITSFIVVFFMVKVLNINMKESFEKKKATTKFIGVCLLSIGSYLII